MLEVSLLINSCNTKITSSSTLRNAPPNFSSAAEHKSAGSRISRNSLMTPPWFYCPKAPHTRIQTADRQASNRFPLTGHSGVSIENHLTRVCLSRQQWVKGLKEQRIIEGLLSRLLLLNMPKS